MKFKITGADQDSGDLVEMTIEAPDETAAEELAHRKRIMISSIAPIAMEPALRRSPSRPQAGSEQGHSRGAPVVNVRMPRRGSSLGIASLVLGILAFLICWVPFVNLVGVPLSGLGLVLGLIGVLVAFTRKGASIGFPIAGVAVCGLSLFIAIAFTGALVGAVTGAANQIAADRALRERTNQAVVALEPSSTLAKNSASPTLNGRISRSGAARAEDGAVEQWAAADKPVRQGDVEVKVVSVRDGRVSTVERITGEKGASKDSLLSITIEISNLSETKKVDYLTWSEQAFALRSGATIVDNFGNPYKLVNFGFGTDVVGSTRGDSIYPGKSIQDTIVFEEPVAKAEYLNLELPADRFGGTGKLRIRIPASMVQR
jgi:hypothetical protein